MHLIEDELEVPYLLCKQPSLSNIFTVFEVQGSLFSIYVLT